MTQKSGMLIVVLLAWISGASYLYLGEIHASDMSGQTAANESAEKKMVDSLLTSSSDEVLNKKTSLSKKSNSAVDAELPNQEAVVLSQENWTCYFDFAKKFTTLKDEEFAYLNELAAYLKQNSDAKIKLEGHADNRGSYKANVEFSRARAEFVRDLLIDAGVDRHQIELRYFGANKPAVENDTEDGRAKNRRVKLEILKF